MRSAREFPFFRINDLAVPLVLFFLVFSFNDRGDETSECRLEVNTGDSILHYELSADSIFTVIGNLGEMEISIENERARISSSPCPGQDCVRQSWLSRAGDMAVCVPSGVFIVISGKDENLSPDAVSY